MQPLRSPFVLVSRQGVTWWVLGARVGMRALDSLGIHRWLDMMAAKLGGMPPCPTARSTRNGSRVARRGGREDNYWFEARPATEGAERSWWRRLFGS
jgi:hypothetical protein